MTILASSHIFLRCRRFWGPSGDIVCFSSVGFRVRKANRFPTINRPQPNASAKPMQRRIVLSFFTASAVEGLSMMNRHVFLLSPSFRSRRYRYLPHFEMMAPMPYCRRSSPMLVHIRRVPVLHYAGHVFSVLNTHLDYPLNPCQHNSSTGRGI